MTSCHGTPAVTRRPPLSLPHLPPSPPPFLLPPPSSWTEALTSGREPHKTSLKTPKAVKAQPKNALKTISIIQNNLVQVQVQEQQRFFFPLSQNTLLFCLVMRGEAHSGHNNPHPGIFTNNLMVPHHLISFVSKFTFVTLQLSFSGISFQYGV